MPTFTDRLSHAWNAFMNKDPTASARNYGMASSSVRPDRVRVRYGIEKTTVSSIYNRIANDIAATNIVHARLDDEGRYIETIKSGLNYCLNTEANMDQSSVCFMRDVVLSLFDEGVVALVPVDTDVSPTDTGSYDIRTLRTAKILEWRPESVKVHVYNERTGQFEDIFMLKRNVAIIENPFYLVMNEPNSTVKRLTHKLALLDQIDEQSSAGKLDLIIQLPYVVKNESRKKQAEERRKDIEMQLSGTKYGIAYTDGTEKITQLNRPIENNLLKQIEYLTELLYSQLGMTKEILNGSATADAMSNYYTRTIEPVVDVIIAEIRRKFLTKTARSQNQTIYYFRDPFKIIPIDKLANIADTFTRNEIMTSNEIRMRIGLKPSAQPGADELRNKNINQSAEAAGMDPMADNQNGVVPGQQSMDQGPDAIQEAIQNVFDSPLKDFMESDNKVSEEE